MVFYVGYFFFQAEDGIRDLVRSRGLGDVYKRQLLSNTSSAGAEALIDQLRHLLRSGALTARPAFSAGIATWTEGESNHDLLKRADRALYAAKAAGKDRSVVA